MFKNSRLFMLASVPFARTVKLLPFKQSDLSLEAVDHGDSGSTVSWQQLMSNSFRLAYRVKKSDGKFSTLKYQQYMKTVQAQYMKEEILENKHRCHLIFYLRIVRNVK